MFCVKYIEVTSSHHGSRIPWSFKISLNGIYYNVNYDNKIIINEIELSLAGLIILSYLYDKTIWLV